VSGWVPKRFWKEAQVDRVDGGFAVRLDGRPVRTPAKTPLVVPTLAMAEAIAVEWGAQEGVVKPLTMPVTRSANAALDKVAVQFDEVAGLIAAYGGSDLLCYRATGPDRLIARQAEAWDPLLDWAVTALHAPLVVTQGIVPVSQPETSLTRLSARVSACTAFELTALHDLVAITGSLVLGLAVTDVRLDPETAWTLSRIDETWQADLWGRDEEAEAMEVKRREGLLHAGRFYRLCRG
jgi:chaperone required for assembly of F1-ATPase